MDGPNDFKNQDNNKENTTILTVSPILILLFVVSRKDGLGLLGKRQKIDRFRNFLEAGIYEYTS